MAIKVLDLFAGVGGFSLGLRWAGGFETVAFVEIDPFCQRVLRKHWPDVPIHEDVRGLSVDAIGPVDIVTGGFPCQPWSVAGQQRGVDDDRDLWPEMLQIVAAARPRWIVGENVSGFVSHEMGLDRVLADLDDLGYSCQALRVPACAVDAPHIRDRVWIVAHAADARCEAGAPGADRALWRHGQAAGRAGSDGLGGGSDALGARPQERAGERGDDGAQRPASERGGDVGDAAGTRRESEPRSGQTNSRWSAVTYGRASEVGHWSDAEWLWCEFDQRWRRTQSSVRRVDDGLSGRMDGAMSLLARNVPNRAARLRGLGNAVVPQIVEQIGLAILEAEAA